MTWGWHPSFSFFFSYCDFSFSAWTDLAKLAYVAMFSCFWLSIRKVILSSLAFVILYDIWAELSTWEDLIELMPFPGLSWCPQPLILQNIEITSGTLVEVKEWKCLQSLAPIRGPFFSEEFLILNRQGLLLHPFVFLLHDRCYYYMNACFCFSILLSILLYLHSFTSSTSFCCGKSSN